MLAFTPDHTLRPARIMPIFKWKLDLALAEARFEYAWEGYNRQSFYIGENLHNKVGSFMAGIMRPIVKGRKDDENRIVAARLIK